MGCRSRLFLPERSKQKRPTFEWKSREEHEKVEQKTHGRAKYFFTETYDDMNKPPRQKFEQITYYEVNGLFGEFRDE